MAELVLQVGDTSTFKDGDILSAFNQRLILSTHAQHICDVRKFGFTGDGTRQAGTLADDWLATVSEFKFERTGPDSIRRTVLRTGSSQRFTSKERVAVEEYIRRRRSNHSHTVFGVAGHVKVTTRGDDEVTLSNLAAGVVHPISVKKVHSTGTTATNIIGLY